MNKLLEICITLPTDVTHRNFSKLNSVTGVIQLSKYRN